MKINIKMHMKNQEYNTNNHNNNRFRDLNQQL